MLLNTIQQFLFGDASPVFLAELVIRSTVVFCMLLIFVRWLGNRLSGEMSSIELAVMVLLGAMVALPMQSPETGLLQAVVVVMGTLLIYKGISWLGFRSKKAEETMQGKTSMLVKDGRLCLDEMKELNVSREQLFAALRNEQVSNLGQIKRVYLEACGLYSIYRASQSQPGLPLTPLFEPLLLRAQQQPVNHVFSCKHCGHSRPAPANAICAFCESSEWMQAYSVK